MAGSSRAAVFLASLPPVNTGDRSFWDVADDSTHSIQPFANVLEVASDLARFLNFAWPYGIKARSTSQNIYADLECTGAQQCTLVAFRSSLALKTVRALNAQSPGKCCAENVAFRSHLPLQPMTSKRSRRAVHSVATPTGLVMLNDFLRVYGTFTG